MLCLAAFYNQPLDSLYTLNGIKFENILSEMNKQLNFPMRQCNLNTTHWSLSGDLDSC